MLLRGTLFLDSNIMFFLTMTFNYAMRSYDRIFSGKIYAAKNAEEGEIACWENESDGILDTIMEFLAVKNAEKRKMPVEKMNLKMEKRP